MASSNICASASIHARTYNKAKLFVILYEFYDLHAPTVQLIISKVPLQPISRGGLFHNAIVSVLFLFYFYICSVDYILYA